MKKAFWDAIVKIIILNVKFWQTCFGAVDKTVKGRCYIVGCC
jgi:hypothetical protein